MLGILVFPRATVAHVRAHARADARIVAVDAGADVLQAAGIVPARVIGDLDSASPEAIAAAREGGAWIDEHDPHKRDTDGALALAALEGCDEVLFLGAGGGRPDHALANLHLLAEASLRARAWSMDEDARTWIATPERPLALALPVGATLSAIPFDPVVEGITYEGLAYPLEGATMRAGDPYGVSNVADAPRQSVRVAKGRLVVIAPTG